ncbi:MAG: beta-ketoacyl-[acyl-carrier-protein] synthase family protein [Flavobacteriales bacterium]|nr:beta-ketoacyl-[acyl-carrier-protein] synthase family protein [Flavobacteriales bacterium]MBK9537538.1 beta-ketoacyl-[acyl-carrier-protein] synthase family protein [Flavobacteriales bacterium]
MASEVVITGLGVISALGRNTQENLDALLAERSGIGPITVLDTRHRGSILVAEVPFTDDALGALAAPKSLRGWTRTALLGLTAVREALQQAGLDPTTTRTGLISATTAGGIDKTEPIYDHYFLPVIPPDSAQYLGTHDPGDHSERIAAELGFHDLVTTISTACSSSANALIFGARLIRNGLLDAAVVGGADALCKFTVNGFNSLMILDKEPCRPFDRDRAGLNLGEAGAYLVLESAAHAARRGAKALAKVSGYANTNEAFHATASAPDGAGALKAMELALRSAGLQPQEVSYVNVHGTGTANNDASEGTALLRLFGDRMPPFSSTKSFTGHTLGAAGAVEAIYSVLAIQHGVHYANLRFKTPIEAAPLKPVLHTQRGVVVQHVLSSSFGFGGNNTSLVISAP